MEPKQNECTGGTRTRHEKTGLKRSKALHMSVQAIEERAIKPKRALL
jgi:hypothetical protein